MARILLVDDDISIRGFLQAALEKDGHHVDICGDGAEAVQYLQRNFVYDLLLTDIVMPNMDGLELTAQAKTLHPHLKIMYITGFAGLALDNNDKSDNIQVISKPFHLKDIVKQVNGILTK